MPGQTSKLTQWRRIGALDMLLLQVIHGLAHGEHAGSSRDAKQLARFAAAIRDMGHAGGTGYSDTWQGEKVTLDADDVAWLRTLINSALPHAAKLTYEARERLIAKFDSKSSVVRAFHKMRRRVLEAIVDRELAMAENEKLIREARAASEAHRKRRREEMESDEHFRKYRKQAEEGDGEAAAFFESVGWPITEPAD